MPAAPMLGHHVVDGQVAPHRAAVLARVPVAAEDLATAQLDTGLRSLDVVLEPDHGGRGDGHRHGVDDLVVASQELGLFRTEQPECAPDVADVERLVVLVQDQYGCIDHRAQAFLSAI